MVNRSARSQLVIALVAACAAFLAVVSASHVHPGGANDSLSSQCQLCLAGQMRLGSGAVVAVSLGLVFVAWCVLRPPAVAPHAPAFRRPASRAPPVQ